MRLLAKLTDVEVKMLPDYVTMEWCELKNGELVAIKFRPVEDIMNINDYINQAHEDDA